jgi:hypothetical protein
MKSIDFLEHGGGHFHVRHHGELIPLPDPRAQHYQWVLLVLHMQHVPGTPGDLPERLRHLVFERWCAAWDLPDFQTAQRLAYLVDHYRAPIAHDLHVHAHSDLGDLWRARRWTLLLDILDRLPAHSWFAATVSMDEEHAKMMADSIQAQRKDGEEKTPSGPHLTGWTPEVAALTNVLDAVRGVQHAVIAVAAGKKAPEPPKPAPRPITPLERAMKAADFAARKAKHESLVARVLRKKQ